MPGLDDFLAGATAVAPAVEAPPAAPEEPVSTEPEGVFEITLPSGIEVYYQAGPKRLYRLKGGDLLDTEAEALKIDLDTWREVPSCTTITDLLDKPGLSHWGEETGVLGVKTLLEKGYVSLEDVKRFSVEMIREVMKEKSLRTWQRRDKAGTRGTSVHRAMESWAMTGTVMDPEAFPVEEQGYVIGCNKWIAESDFKPLRSEVVVASQRHSFAGRFDIAGELEHDSRLVSHITKSGNLQFKSFPADSYLVDLKTSKGVYPDHHIQVAGYQGAMEESGYPKPNRTAILRVTFDGHYEFVEGKADWLSFWFARGLFDELAAIKAS